MRKIIVLLLLPESKELLYSTDFNFVFNLIKFYDFI